MFQKLGFSFLVLLAFIATAEGAARTFIPEEALLFSWERSDGLLARRADGAWSSRPGLRTQSQDGPYTWTIRINTDGLRSDQHFTPRKPRGTYRILAVGDSWIFGFSVTQGRTMVDQVGALLSQEWHQPVEVLNAGVLGASAFQTLQQWQAYSARYELDAVLVGTPHNMGEQQNQAAERMEWYARTTAGPANHVRLYLLLRRFLYVVDPRSLSVPQWSINTAGQGSSDQLTAIADLSRIASEARERNLAIWFGDFPGNLRGAMSAGGQPTPVDPTWSAALQPFGAIIAGHQLGERSCWGFVDQDHPSEAGSAVIAHTLVQAILNNRSLSVRATEPRCAAVPEVGPGKNRWENTPIR